jgi:prepilin-type processing-associated H-X9-DG protein
MGGTTPNPDISGYLRDSNPSVPVANRKGPANGPNEQGLGWMFQILPYLEEGAIAGIVNQNMIQQQLISVYNCPSRRRLMLSPSGVSLIDYAGVTAGPSRSELGNSEFTNYMNDPAGNHWDIFWGSSLLGTQALPSVSTVAGALAAGKPIQFRGIIQRADWLPTGTPPYGVHVGFARKVTFSKIPDGTTKTLLVSEKRVPPSRYEPSLDTMIVSDDKGWADGWDYDNLRSTMFPLEQDGEVKDVSVFAPIHYQFGSAHSGGVNAIFADGSVTTISYEVDRENFNRLGHRHDGETITETY